MPIHPALKALAEKRRKDNSDQYDPAVDEGWKEEMQTLHAKPATADVVELPDGMTHENLEDFDHIQLSNLMDILTEDDPQ